jgi:hypothetical protein
MRCYKQRIVTFEAYNHEMLLNGILVWKHKAQQIVLGIFYLSNEMTNFNYQLHKSITYYTI